MMHISHRCTLGFLHTISFTPLVCTLRAVSIAIWKESLTKLPVCDAFWRVIVCLLAGARWKHWKFFSCANLIIVHHTTFVAIQAFLVDWAGKEVPSLNHWETQFQSSHISVKPNDNNRSLLYNYLNSFFKPLTFRLAKYWQVLLSSPLRKKNLPGIWMRERKHPYFLSYKKRHNPFHFFILFWPTGVDGWSWAKASHFIATKRRWFHLTLSMPRITKFLSSCKCFYLAQTPLFYFTVQ